MRWRAALREGCGVCVHVCTCSCHSAIHRVFSLSLESYFHQAHLLCCPQDTVERFHQLFKMLSKILSCLGFFLDACEILQHGAPMWESSGC